MSSGWLCGLVRCYSGLEMHRGAVLYRRNVGSSRSCPEGVSRRGGGGESRGGTQRADAAGGGQRDTATAESGAAGCGSINESPILQHDPSNQHTAHVRYNFSRVVSLATHMELTSTLF